VLPARSRTAAWKTRAAPEPVNMGHDLPGMAEREGDEARR